MILPIVNHAKRRLLKGMQESRKKDQELEREDRKKRKEMEKNYGRKTRSINFLFKKKPDNFYLAFFWKLLQAVFNYIN